MTKEEFKELFRYKFWLIPAGEETPEDFIRYIREAAVLRSQLIIQLRYLGLPGWKRAQYNDALEHLIPDYKQYLYKISPDCRLCNYPIVHVDQATIDHIVARADGGCKGIANQQLAHPWCNVAKGSDFNKRTDQHTLPRKRKKKHQLVFYPTLTTQKVPIFS
jgi:5-methylcytosine-specific restriction endonuclease McrA